MYRHELDRPHPIKNKQAKKKLQFRFTTVCLIILHLPALFRLTIREEESNCVRPGEFWFVAQGVIQLKSWAIAACVALS